MMKNSKSQWYSKSPWVVIGDKVGPIRSYGYEGCDKEHKEVAIVPQVLGSFEGDLHLISAAPEMYELLETIENDSGQVPEWLRIKIQEVLKKARGDGNE